MYNELKTELEMFLKYLNQSNDGMYGDVEKGKNSINDIIKSISSNKKIDKEKISLLIGPTANLQEISIDNGWEKEFLIIAEKIDKIIG